MFSAILLSCFLKAYHFFIDDIYKEPYVRYDADLTVIAALWPIEESLAHLVL